MRPAWFRPARLRPLARSDFSGRLLVTSSKPETDAPRRPGVVGLYFLLGILTLRIRYFVSKISIESPAAKVTTARFWSARRPVTYRERLTFPLRVMVLTPTTWTFQIFWIASLISVLLASGCTRKVYRLASSPA